MPSSSVAGAAHRSTRTLGSIMSGSPLLLKHMRSITSLAYLGLLVAALCWKYGIPGGLVASANTLLVISFAIAAMSAILALTWRQRFFQATEIIACAYAICYLIYLTVAGHFREMAILVFGGIGTGVIIGLAVAWKYRRGLDGA